MSALSPQPGGVDPQFGRYTVPVCPPIEEYGTEILIGDLWGTRLEMTPDGWISGGREVPMAEVCEMTLAYGAQFAVAPFVDGYARRRA